MKYLIFTISVLLFLSCEKNNTTICQDISCLEVECEPSDCIDLSDSMPENPWLPPNDYYPNEFTHNYSVNPNNPNQYVIGIINDSLKSIKAMDGSIILFSQDLPFSFNININNSYKLKWGANGKILLDNYGEIWVINENGDSLIKITPPDGVTGDFGADWSPDGKYIVFNRMRADSAITRTYKMNISNQNLKLLGTLSSNLVVWSPNGKFLAYNRQPIGSKAKIYFYDLLSGSETELFISSNRIIGSLDWYDNENIIWSDADGVFITNINTKDTRWLRKTCGNISYGILEVDKNKNVYVNKSFWSLTNNNLDYYIEPYIYQIDISSCMEQEVEL